MEKVNITQEELIKKVVEAIRGVSGIQISPDKYGENLFDLGLDSLAAIQVVNQLEDELDIMIDDVHLQKFISIDAITKFFLSHHF